MFENIFRRNKSLAYNFKDKKMKKTFIKFLSAVAPTFVTNLAYRVLTNPQISKMRENEMLTLNKAQKETMDFKGFQIQTYTWRGGKESVLLVHGWEGQAGNFSDLIEQLIQANYTIYAFDAPSHGLSSRGQTSLFEFSELIGTLIEKWHIAKIVSHSFGGVATTYALKSNPTLKIQKYALLTTPDRFSERINYVSAMVGISENVKKRLITKLEKLMAGKVQDFNVSDFVKQIAVDSALIIHDKNDKIIPISQSRQVFKNWQNAQMIEIEDTGHFKILRTESVLKTVIQFLN